jgi:hypothetical protein
MTHTRANVKAATGHGHCPQFGTAKRQKGLFSQCMGTHKDMHVAPQQFRRETFFRVSQAK